MKLEGEVAVVSGAAQGIGRAIASAFVSEGARVAALDINADKLAQSAAEIGDEAVISPYVCDVTDEQAIADVFARVQQRYGKISALVCNAATTTELSPVEGIPTEAWRKALDVNLTSAFLMSKHGIPCLRSAGGGRVIITASQMAKVAWMGQAAYCATKGALVQLAKVMALDHAHENIRVNTLSPGGTGTERLIWRFGSLDEAEREWGPKHPVGRLGKVEEIARGAVFLASSDSEFMTGADLVMDGGYTAW